jgi:hypothetical protein
MAVPLLAGTGWAPDPPEPGHLAPRPRPKVFEQAFLLCWRTEKKQSSLRWAMPRLAPRSTLATRTLRGSFW